MKQLKKHLTVANVISCIALFVALSGAAYAATTTLGKNVGEDEEHRQRRGDDAQTEGRLGDQRCKLANGAVTGPKIANGAVGAGAARQRRGRAPQRSAAASSPPAS